MYQEETEELTPWTYQVEEEAYCEAEVSMRDVCDDLHDELVHEHVVELRPWATTHDLPFATVMAAAIELATYDDHTLDLGSITLRVK